MREIGKIPSAGAGRLAISSDGKLLAAISGGYEINLWDIASRTQFGRPIQLGDTWWTVGVVFSPDARRLITGNANLNSMVAFDLNVESWIEQACELCGVR
jgi:WD40 repeat protein